jgi:GT2 family glycosyltransferase
MLTISILNYWNWRDTARSILDLLVACQGLRYRILVRDNSESSQVDSLRAELHATGAPITYFESPDNPGFGRGHNRNFWAVQHAAEDAFLVLNNDIRIPDASAIKAMLQMLAPQRILSSVIRTSTHGEVWFSGGTINRLTGDVIIDRVAFQGPWRATSFVSGCCLMISAGLFHHLGGFDEGFFMYGEDLDLCLRARQRGAELLVVNRHIVHKVGSGEKGQYSDTYLYENTKNRLICLRRHRLGAVPVSAPYFVLRYGVARTAQLMMYSRRPMAQIRAAWRGLWDGFFREQHCPVDSLQPIASKRPRTMVDQQS